MTCDYDTTLCAIDAALFTIRESTRIDIGYGQRDMLKVRAAEFALSAASGPPVPEPCLSAQFAGWPAIYLREFRDMVKYGPRWLIGPLANV